MGVRGLKPNSGDLLKSMTLSHPVGVRGLKHGKLGSCYLLAGSHPVGVRGLKRKAGVRYKRDYRVAPRGGAWIETVSNSMQPFYLESHPVGVRGLKQLAKRYKDGDITSHPVGVRGLKQNAAGSGAAGAIVAPRGGAWIETFTLLTCRGLFLSRTPWGCVD